MSFKAAAVKIKAATPDVAPFGMQGKEIETDVYFTTASGLTAARS